MARAELMLGPEERALQLGEGLPVSVYAAALKGLRNKANGFDRSLGYFSYLQGRILRLARKQCVKPGSWSRFLTLAGQGSVKPIKPGTARLLMKIAEKFTRDAAATRGYTEMLKQIYPSFKLELQQEAETDSSDGVSTVTSAMTHPGRSRSAKKQPTAVDVSSVEPAATANVAASSGGKRHPLTVAECKKLLEKLLREAQDIRKSGVKIADATADEIEDANRLIESIANELSIALDLVNREKRAAA